MAIPKQDETWLREALALAALGRMTCAPNPMVGAVVVRDGAAVGRGFHVRAGGPHAEIHALREAGPRACGATLFVSLEPCSTHGRTPPCTDAIIAAGIARMVAATRDPNPAHAGRGFEILRASGIIVECVDDPEATRLNEKFNHFITTGLPFVHAKWAMSCDGRMTTPAGREKWISCEASRALVHAMRSEHDAVMVGIGTVLADNPRLDVRIEGDVRQPVKVIVDSTLRMPEDAAVIGGAPVILACGSGADPVKRARFEKRGVRILELPTAVAGVDLSALVAALGREGLSSVLVEGGNTLLQSLFTQRLVQRATVFVAPVELGREGGESPVACGDEKTIAQTLGLRDVETRASGVDLLVTGRCG